MARILLDIADGTTRFTIKVLIEAENHTVVSRNPEVIITDSVTRAVDYALHHNTILLVTHSDAPKAVKAMQQGVFGYALFPLIPGEIEIMVRRAVEHKLIREKDMSTLIDNEMRYILDVLKMCHNNKTMAARVLGIGRNTLWRKLQKYKSHMLREAERE